MKEIDQLVINKYKLTESEAEDYIERMGLLVENNGEDDITASQKCIEWAIKKRSLG